MRSESSAAGSRTRIAWRGYSHRLTAAILVCALLAVVGPAHAAPRAAARDGAAAARPNVLLIVADDLGWSDVSTYGGRAVATPNIDRIAGRGVAFTSGYVVAPVCAISRGGLLTGRYPQRFGFEYNISDEDVGRGLPKDQRLLSDRLRAAGYRTAALGKWHLGTDPGQYPTDRGFEEFTGFTAGISTYVDPRVPGYVAARAPVPTDPGPVPRAGGAIVVTGPDRTPVDNFDRYLTDDLTDRAIEYVSRDRGGAPFFLYLAYNAPHRPFQAPAAYYERFAGVQPETRRVYLAMIAALDAQIGRLLDALEAKRLTDDTLIVFLSDNGCPNQLSVCDCTQPVNAGKFTHLEGGIRVPFVLSWPRGLAQRGRSDAPVNTLDVAPTVLRAAGIAAPAAEFDGLDLRAVVRRPKLAERRALFWRQSPVLASREGRWKLWKSLDWPETRLYDVQADPGETIDLAAREPAVARRLDERLTSWAGTLSSPLWSSRIVGRANVCGRETETVY